MSFLGSRRSVSENRNARYNPITSEYEPVVQRNPPTRDAYPQQSNVRDSLTRDIPTIAAKEILRQSYQPGSYNNQNNYYQPEVEASPQKMRQPTDNSIAPPTGNDFYRQQIPNGESPSLDRKNRYKEVLGRMMEQDKEKKMREKMANKETTPIDQHTWNTFMELEKAQEQEEKRRVKELLLKDLDEARRREEEKKKQQEREKMEYDNMVVSLKKVDDQLKEQEKYVKKQTLAQYKIMLDGCKQELDDRRKVEAEENKRWAVYEYEDIKRKDEERQKFYVEIRERVNKELAAFRPFIEEKKEKEQLIENNIQKAVKERQEKDEYEARRKEEFYKKMNQAIKQTNDLQLQEKQEKGRKLKDDLQREWEECIANIKGSQMLTNFEKEKRLEQAREYYQSLQGQMTEKRNAVDPYKGGKSEAIFGENSYERNLQLKYLDAYLNENPSNPYASKAQVKNLRNETGNAVLSQRFSQPSMYQQPQPNVYGQRPF